MAGMFYEIIPGYGYCLNVDDAHNTVRVYQEQTRNRYCSTIKTPKFGQIDVRAKSRKIHWEDDQKGKVTRECLLYDSVPFHILGKKVFYCEFGRNRNKKTVKDKDGNNRVVKPTMTKKVDCPALIYMKEVMKYPAYMIDENSAAARTKMADKLRSDIAEGKAEGERRIYIVFPNIKEHQNHAVYYDGKLMYPKDIPFHEEGRNQETEISIDTSSNVSVSPSSLMEQSDPNNGERCRELIDQLHNFVCSNATDVTLLQQAENMLSDTLDFLSSDPPISVLLHG